jgi:hypothetical protein
MLDPILPQCGKFLIIVFPMPTGTPDHGHDKHMSRSARVARIRRRQPVSGRGGSSYCAAQQGG